MRYPPIARDLLFFVVGSIAGMFVTYRIVKPPVDSIVDQLKACRQKLPQPAFGVPDDQDPQLTWNKHLHGNDNTIDGPALDTWVVGAGIWLTNPRHVIAVSCMPETAGSWVSAQFVRIGKTESLHKICDGKQWE